MPTNDCTGNCNCTPNPLNSGNWQSESTTKSSNPSDLPNTNPGPSGSPSGSPPSKCEIDYYPKYDTVPWLFLHYDATKGLDTNCHSEDIEYSISPNPFGYHMSPDGMLSWDERSDGEIIEITGACVQEGATEPKAKSKKKLTIPKLRIFHRDVDITNQIIRGIEVGNRIVLSAVVTPAEVEPPPGQYGWKIPQLALHDYDVEAHEKPVKKLTNEMLREKSVTFHWVTGGKKTVEVSCVVNGIQLIATADFMVSRPLSRITGKAVSQPSVINDKDPKKWTLYGGVIEFTATPPDIAGETGWTQMLDYAKTLEIRQGEVVFEDPRSGISSGLDEAFDYGHVPGNPLKTSDTPRYASTNYNITWVQNDMDANMYLMWKSSKTNIESRWVPLRKIYWQLRSRGAMQNFGAPTAKLEMDSSSFLYCSPNDTAADDSPDWERILNPLKKPQ